METVNEEAWDNETDDPPFWRICAHVVFYVDFYYSTLQSGAINLNETYTLPEFLHRYATSWIQESKDTVSKEDMLHYLEYARNRIRSVFAGNIASQLSEPSGFEWLPMTKGELLLYNMRHIMEHTAILNQILKKYGLPASSWKGIVEI